MHKPSFFSKSGLVVLGHIGSTHAAVCATAHSSTHPPHVGTHLQSTAALHSTVVQGSYAQHLSANVEVEEQYIAPAIIHDLSLEGNLYALPG